MVGNILEHIIHNRNNTVLDIILNRIKTHKDHVALVDNNATITFCEMHRKATYLAEEIIAAGVKHDDIVAIAIEPSIDFIITALACWYAGAAYFAIDNQQPSQRIQTIIDVARPVMLIAQQHETIYSLVGVNTILIIDDISIPDNYYVNDILLKENYQKLSPDNLAYVIFTSGSTGAPKGVAITHAAFFNHMNWLINAFAIKDNDVVLLKTPVIFDASLWEQWLGVMVGCKTIIMNSFDAKDSYIIKKTIDQYQVTTVQFVPILLQGFVEASVSKKCQSLRRVFCGGEALSQQTINSFYKIYACPLINLYGPTENTIDSTVAYCLPENLSKVSIGKPIYNVTAYVLNEKLEEVVPGEMGELYLSGLGLARGYLNQPGLTAEKFLPNIFKKGERLYKTGDLVKLDANFNLEFLGRSDHQVKLHGHRIELNEITEVTKSFFAIQNAVTMLRNDNLYGDYLILYATLRDSCNVDTSLLMDFIKDKLPHYMLPKFIFFLDKMPITPSGKIDLNYLAAQPLDVRGSQSNIVNQKQIEDEVINDLVEIWKKVLHVDIDVNSNFFHLGGDSILSVQIVTLARQMGYELSVKDIFMYPSVEQCAKIIKSRVPLKTDLKERTHLTGVFPLTPIQRWFFSQNFSNINYYNQAYLFELKHPIANESFNKIVNYISQHHNIFKLRFRKDNEIWQQYYTEVDISLGKIIDLSNCELNSIAVTIEKEAKHQQAALNISEGPLFEIILFLMPDKLPQQLLIIAHHLIIDLVSWNILLTNFVQLYEQNKNNQPFFLPHPTTEFGQWADKLAELLKHKNKDAENFWSKYNEEAFSEFPAEFNNDENLTESEATYQIKLNQQSTKKLLGIVKQHDYLSVEELLLVALLYATHECFATNNLTICLENNGRLFDDQDIDVSTTLGWFTWLFPVALTIEDTFAKTLKSNRQSIKIAKKHGHFYLPLAMEKSYAIPKISFNYLGMIKQNKEDGIFFSSKYQAGPTSALKNERPFQITFTLYIDDTNLTTVIHYSNSQHSENKIASFAKNYIKCLNEVITNCKTSDSHIPLDFPLVELAQADIDNLPLKKSIKNILPLTESQTGILYASLLAKNKIYVLQNLVKIQGKLNIPIFKMAWKQVVLAHNILAGRLFWGHSREPLFLITEENSYKLPFSIYDWQGLTIKEQEEKLNRLLSLDQKHGFKLFDETLTRFCIIRCSEEMYYFIWSIHHLITDGWSLSIICQDVLNNYDRLMKDNTYKPQSRRQYSEYIGWLKERDFHKAQQFWLNTLSIDFNKTYLTTRADSQDNFDEIIKHDFVINIDEGLNRYIKQYQVTVNTLVQTAWSLLLMKYTNQSKIAFGVTISGRDNEFTDIHSMVGLFINTLPLCIVIDRNMTLENLLHYVQKKMLECTEYGYYSFIRIKQDAKSLGFDELFNTLIVFENYAFNNLSLSNFDHFEFTPIKSTENNEFPLTITVNQSDNLNITFSYQGSSFSSNIIKQIAAHFEYLLKYILKNSGNKIFDLKLTTDLSCLKGPELKFDLSKHYLVASLQKSFIENSHEIALIHDGIKFTYSNIDKISNKLAHYLLKQQCTPQAKIVICLPRNYYLLISLIAVLKIAAIYLPIDRFQPKERIKYILNDSQAEFVIHSSEDRHLFEFTNLKKICIESIVDELANEQEVSLTIADVNSLLAYIIYTSGSTGNPKGVMNSQSNLLYALLSFKNTLPLKKRERLLAITTISFDISILELLLPLFCGATLVLADDDIVRDPEQIVNFIKKYKCKIVQATPSMWQLLMDCHFRKNNKLVAFCGGEALSSTLAKHLLKKVAALINLYGPTETTIWSAIAFINSENTDIISLGVPLPGSTFYILDNNLKPVPKGVIGELYISSLGTSYGYYNQSALTAKTFLPDPFAELPGQRLYKTGDLVCLTTGGQLLFLGRVDHQIKIRGNRVELGEIEQLLIQHPAIKQVIILPKKDKHSNSDYLCGFIVFYETMNLSIEAITEYLAKSLPSYMIPNSYYFLKELPCLPNGKIDRKKLETISVPDNNDLKEDEPTPNSIELQLLNIWQKILDRKVLRLSDNFFHVGGHSLLALSLLQKIKSEFDVEINLASLIQYSTISSQAVLIEKVSQAGDKFKNLVTLKQSQEAINLFLFHPAGGTVLCYQELADHLQNMNVFGIQQDINSPLSHIKSVADYVNTYVKVIKCVQPKGPYYLAGWSFGGLLALSTAQKLQMQGNEIAFIALIDSHLSTDPQHVFSNLDETSLVMALFNNELEIDVTGLQDLTTRERLEILLKAAKRQGLIAQEFTADIAQKYLEIYKYNEKLNSAYIPESYNGQLNYYLAEEDSNFEIEKKKWEKYITREFKLYKVSGKHINMLTAKYVKKLAELLNSEISKISKCK